MIKTKLNIEALPDEFVESLATKDDINDINSALTDVDTALSDKQDVLVSGTNIKTVNGTTLLGKGNINIPIYDDTEIVQSIQEIQEHISENEEVVAEALTDLDTNKASKSDVAQMIGTSTETLETLQNITEYIVNNGQEAANLVENVQINAENIDETKKMAVDSKTLDISYAENDIDIHYNAIDGGEYSLKIEVATEESAGVMSAEDKREQVKKTPLVNGDTIVGQAREIHSRNGKTVSDSFLARTTAGSGTIGDGVASLKSVGGNIVRNLVDGTFTSGWSNQYNVTHSIKNGVCTITSKTAYYGIKHNCQTISNHLYYLSTDIYTPNSACLFEIGGGISFHIDKSNAWQNISIIWEKTTQWWAEIKLATRTNSTSFSISHFIFIDLTEMFGAGKEPTKEECDRMFSTMDALPQGLTIAKPTEFKSTSFNQFNPDNVLDGKTIIDNAIVSGDKKIAVIPCLPCKVGVGENNGYCIHGDFGDDIKVYLTPLNPMEVEGELYMHELTKDATTDTYVPLIKGYLLVEVPTTANLCAHFLWSEDKCERDTYEPYFESKVELPVIPQMSEWGLAGIQSSGTLAADTIDLERMVYTKRIGSVDLGSLSWTAPTESDLAFLSSAVKDIGLSVGNLYIKVINLICEPFVVVKNGNRNNKSAVENSIWIHADYKNRICIQTSKYTDSASIKAALQGVMLYYELAEPEEYPLPKVDNNYISSDYGVEQFDGVVPCNANNLYYMRSLAGETRNFLDRLYDNTDKTDAKDVADYITSGIEGNKELATNAPNLALRALFIAAGAEYNDTGADKTKTAPWGETVTHKAGYYYLNGLGDITEEDMTEIYNAGRVMQDVAGFYNSNINIRTNLPSLHSTADGYSSYFNGRGMFCACKMLEVAIISVNKSLADRITSNSNDAQYVFLNCPKVRYISKLNLQGGTSTLSMFKLCSSLSHVEIINLSTNLSFSDSPLIDKESILHLIQNNKATSAITITLHADAYARLANDADIVAALEAQPLVTLVSA